MHCPDVLSNHIWTSYLEVIWSTFLREATGFRIACVLVRVTAVGSGIDPHIVIRPLALVGFQKYLPNLRVHLNKARSAALGLIENDQVAEEIT